MPNTMVVMELGLIIPRPLNASTIMHLTIQIFHTYPLMDQCSSLIRGIPSKGITTYSNGGSGSIHTTKSTVETVFTLDRMEDLDLTIVPHQ
jgi:hypothetical protein